MACLGLFSARAVAPRLLVPKLPQIAQASRLQPAQLLLRQGDSSAKFRSLFCKITSLSEREMQDI
jgi:hypothetical protein